MNQLSENGPPEDQSNPFAAPSVAVAEAGHLSAAERMSPLAQYSTVRLGLQMIYYSIATVAGMVVLMLLVGFAMSATGGPPAATGFQSVAILGGIVCLVAMLVMLVGFCMTIACPRSDEKSRAIISVVCFFLAFGISIVGRIFLARLASPSGGAAASLALSLTTNILYIASSVLFCLLLKRIGRNISSSRLEKSARSMLVWYGISFVVAIVGVGAMSFMAFNAMRASSGGSLSGGGSLGPLAGIVGVLAMIAISLVVLFKYLAMLRAGIEELAVKRHV